MIYLLKSLKFPGSILRLRVVDDKIYVLDNKFILFVYSNETFTLLEKYFLLQNQDDKHIYENTLAISKNLNFYHSFTKSPKGLIFTLDKEKIHKSLDIELHHRDVSYAKFSHNAKTLLIGGEDGRSCFYDVDSKRAFFSLEPRSDFISSAVFSESDKLVCIGAYDKAIRVHSIEQHKDIATCNISDTPEDLIFVHDNTQVIGITRDRKLFSYIIKEDTLEYANMLFAEWPTSLIRIGSNHILVATKGDVLYIFDISTLSLVKRFQVDNFGVKTLEIHNNYLYIGYSNGELKIINTNHLYREFELNLDQNKFAKATSLIRENIFLITKDIASKYDNVWKQVLEMAKNALLEQDTQRAERIVKPFFWDKQKKDEFTALHLNIADIKHFEHLVEQGSDLVALRFADEKEHLKTNKGYQELEINFNKKFQLAKTLFSKNTQEDIQSAKNIIIPYLKVEAKKNLVTSLILNYKIFARSLRLIKSRNFKVYFRLVEHNVFLKDEDLYAKVVEIGNQKYSKLLTLEQKGSYTKAREIAEFLDSFTPFANKVLDVEEIMDSKIELMKLIKANDIRQIYNKVSQSSELESTPHFIEYHKNFEEKKDIANDFANQGKSLEVKETLEDHLNIEFLLNSIAMIFKLSYLVELELAMHSESKDVNIRATLERYALLFGIDSELHLLSKRLNFDYLVPEYPPNPNGFKTNDFFDYIVVKT